MRVRITHRRPGEVDGVDLNTFEVGLMYDVSPSLATYLIMTGTADPVVDERPALVVPVDDIPHSLARASSAPRERAIAAEQSGVRGQGSGIRKVAADVENV
jgi:hypothetical protein